MDESIDHELEDRRQIEHLAPLAFAFLLPYLPYWAAISLSLSAVIYALYISPRWIRFTTRKEEAVRGFSPGKLYYALSVLVLLLAFSSRLYIAAAVWAILAVGDSLSNLVGRRLGTVRLGYNPQKSLAGLVTFWIAGGLAAWALLLWNRPDSFAHSWGLLLTYALVAALFCALGESLPAVIDDNLIIPWIGAMTFYLLFSIQELQPRLASPWSHAIGVNLGVATLAWFFRWISWKGTALAFLFGVLVYAAMGLPGYLVILFFLVLGSLATQAGFQRKERLRVAQENRGRRGIANVLSKGLVAFTIALFSFWIDSPLVRVAYTAALATAAFDTVSTEIGQWLGKNPFNPLTLQRVPVGTAGAMSIAGTLAGIAAGVSVSLVAALTNCLPATAVPFVFFGALAGGVFESILASSLVHDWKYAHETLNLYNTLFGAFASGVLWILVNRP